MQRPNSLARSRSGDAGGIKPQECSEPKNKDGPVEVSLDRAVKSAITYFPAEQYHRQDELHFCVRDGNRCFLVLMITDKRLDGFSPAQTVSCRCRVSRPSDLQLAPSSGNGTAM